ncbi:MAG: response regulator [Coriobacteriales bacterium]|jgi:signal transduction histidine kinase/ActR/RegA family two-component response regulator|nr:response regulator [Coriobacteriales bacterium]
MIERLKNIILSYLYDEAIPMQGRLFNVMILIGLVATGMALASHSVISPRLSVFVVMMLSAVVLVVSFALANHFRRYTFAVYVSIILVFDIAYPINFFFWGGLHSSMITFFALTIVFIFLLLSGWRLFWMALLHIAIIASCYFLEFRFPALVTQLPLSYQFIDAVYSLILCAVFIGLVLQFMISTYTAAQTRALSFAENIEHKNALLEVGDHMSSILLTSDIDDFEQGLKMALATLGSAIKVDQITIHKALFDEDDQLLAMDNEFIWTRSGIVQTRTDDTSEQAAIQSLSGLMPRWLAGEITFCSAGENTGDYDDHFLALLRTRGIKSQTTIPIFVDKALWGTVAFDNFTSENSFTDEELHILRSSSQMIVNSIIRIAMIKDFRDAKDAALAGTRAKGDFLSNMSHEIRTPLNAIISMTKLARFEQDTEKVSGYVDRMEQASNHLLGLINDILDVSKIEAGAFELAEVPFSLREMVSHILSIMSFRAKDHAQTLESIIEEDLPDLYLGDDQRLFQVLVNLLGNAVKFTPEGGAIRLAIRRAGTDDLAKAADIREQRQTEDGQLHDRPHEAQARITLCCSVRDTGVGLSEDTKGHIFEVFHQAESTTSRKYGGTGLGLPISRTIVEMMGGTIWVESTLGKGAEFFFTVALPEARPEDMPSQQDSRTTLIDPIDLKGKRLLVAEDFEVNQEILAAVLEGTGVDIVFADNGQLALDAFEAANGNFDMILMDIQMPIMDGYEATRAIRSLWYDNAQTIPIIAQTANVFRDDIEKALEAGMNGHLGKPIDFDELIATLRRFLSE